MTRPCCPLSSESLSAASLGSLSWPGLATDFETLTHAFGEIGCALEHEIDLDQNLPPTARRPKWGARHAGFGGISRRSRAYRGASVRYLTLFGTLHRRILSSAPGNIEYATPLVALVFQSSTTKTEAVTWRLDCRTEIRNFNSAKLHSRTRRRSRGPLRHTGGGAADTGCAVPACPPVSTARRTPVMHASAQTDARAIVAAAVRRWTTRAAKEVEVATRGGHPI